MNDKGQHAGNPAPRQWFLAPPAWDSDDADPLADHVHDRRATERPSGPEEVRVSLPRALGRFGGGIASMALATGLALFAFAIAGGEGLTWRSVAEAV